MKNKTSGKDVYEIRRFCLRCATDIAPHLRGLRFEARPGGECVIRPEDYGDAIGRLKRAGFSVTSVRELTYDLGTIPYHKPASKLWGYQVDDPDQWSYISMIARRWRRCRVDNQGRILLRQGMALADHGTGGRPKYYLVPDDIWFDTSFRLEDYKVRGNEAIRGAYRHVLGTLPVPFWDAGEGLLFGMWPNYVIPKEHENFLSKTLNPLDEPLDSSGGETLWAWHPHDRELIERTLAKLRIRLAPWDAGEDWVNTTSLILRRSYGQYLQRRDGGEELREIIRQRAWEKIEDQILQTLVKKLITLEYEGNSAAHQFMRFMQNRLTMITNYKDHGKDLIGWVIESSPVFYQRRQLDKRYYRLVLPEFDTVAGWETTRRPNWEGEDRPRVKIFQWQIVPYLGRMKTMSRAREPQPEKAGRRLRDQALRSIVGIPSIEWALVKEKAMAAFMLDLDGANWRGCNDLCRYFSSYGKIISLNPVECEGHGLLLEDILGNRFALETEGIPSRFIPETGDWAYFIGHSSLLHHQEWLRLKQDIPVFDLARDRIFRRAYQSHALSDGILAYIKYHWGVSQEDIITSFGENWAEEGICECLDVLLQEENVIREKNLHYYRYSPLAVDEMKAYINMELEDEVWNKARPLLHPLFVRAMRLDGEKLTQELKRLTDSYKIIVKSSISDNELLHDVEKTFDERGWFGFIAAGGQIWRSQRLVDKYAKENPGLRVFRKDDEYKFKDGNKGPSVEYVCWDPLKALQLRYR